MQTDNEEAWDMDTLIEVAQQLVSNVNTLNGAVACILTALNREGIALAKPDSVTIN